MSLNAQQRDALWEGSDPFRGLRIVSARPGTGKTRTLTEYCLELARTWNGRTPWEGLASISFTNVAKDELEHSYGRTESGVRLLRYPHFTGTIDAFLNQYVALPHGGEYMGFLGRPKLVGEPHAGWRTDGGKQPNEVSTALFASYSFGLDGPFRSNGRPVWLDSGQLIVPEVDDENRADIERMKRRLWSTGVLTQTDANFIAYETLRRSPALTRALIERFPVMVVDEAQDMTAVQHGIIDLLVNRGHGHVVLVGDQLQSIYEWNTARPELFIDKTERTDEWSPREINRTYRSGPPICRFLTNLAGGTSLIPEESSKNSQYSEPVQIIEYDRASTLSAVKNVVGLIAELLHNKDPHAGDEDGPLRLALLGRSGDDAALLRSALTGSPYVKTRGLVFRHRLSRDFLRVIHHHEEGNLYGALTAYETLLLNASGYRTRQDLRNSLGGKWAKPGEPFDLAYRRNLVIDLRTILDCLTSASNTITTSASACDAQLICLSGKTLSAIREDLLGFGGSYGAPGRENRRVSTLFIQEDAEPVVLEGEGSSIHAFASTVHGVKGETYDAVVYLTKSITSPCECPSDSREMASILEHDINRCEAKRIIYVATSRAAQLLCIMTPPETSAKWRSLR